MKKLTLTLLLGALAGISPVTYAATNIEFLQNLATSTSPGGLTVQERFKLFSEDLGNAVSYRAVSPAEPLGITGFDIGLEVTYAKMAHSEEWAAVTSSGKELEALILPKVHVHKGLPFNIDIGAFYLGSSNSNIDISGAEIRYAILEGGITQPALALRAAYSKLDGIDQLDMNATNVELSLSKGFAMLTPYIGVGRVRINSEPLKEAALIGLTEETINLTKSFAGVNINMGLINVDIDVDKTGDATAYSLKFGFRW